MPTVAEIRAALAASSIKQNNDNSPKIAGASTSYAFWSIPENSSATVRFLQDANPDNTFFWAHKDSYKLPFNGVVGGQYPTDEPVTVSFPSMTTWDEKDQINEHLRPLWKTDKDLALRFYRKRAEVYQGFVVNSPLVEENTPENPIRIFLLNKSVHDIVTAYMSDADLDDMPTDYAKGCDFKITKTRQGEFANYRTSGFARKSRALTDAERAAIDKFGLHNLADFVGKKPDAATQDLQFQMYLDSRAGKPFDADKYQGFRAFPDRFAQPVAPAVVEPLPTIIAGTTMTPDQILARIHAR